MTTENTAPVSADTTPIAQAPVSEAPVADSAPEADNTPDTSSPADTSKYEVVVDGEKFLLSKDELLKGWQTTTAAMKRFKEAAELRKEAEAKLGKLKQNPLEAFLEAGGDEAAFRAIAENYLYDKIQYEKLSPEEQELKQLRKYREEQEALRQQEAKRREEEVISKQAEHLRENYAKSFTQALSGAGVQPTEKAISRIAQIQLDALEQGYEMPLETAVAYYKEQYTKDVNDYIGGMTTEQLIEALGGRIKDIRKHEVAGLKNPTSRTKKTQTEQKAPAKAKVSASEFFANLKP